MAHFLYFRNANSRDTCFTVHNIKTAHKKSQGKGVKVGIMDWLFAMDEHPDLFVGAADITGNPQYLFEANGHGRMMATTLKEIAPLCEIYAINAVIYNEPVEGNRIEHFEKSIEWAIENQMDVLTYSHAAFRGEDRARANRAVQKAVKTGIISTFIHNDSEANLWPFACFPFVNDESFSRSPDVNIYHFDYNTLFIDQYERYEKAIRAGEPITSGDDLPYFSFSSMAVVLGGFVALLNQIQPSLTAKACKKILRDTSYEIKERGENWYDLNPCQHVVDIGKAVEMLC